MEWAAQVGGTARLVGQPGKKDKFHLQENF